MTGNVYMIDKIILRFFAKQNEDFQNTQVRARIGKASGILGILCNVALAISKLIVGIIESL